MKKVANRNAFPAFASFEIQHQAFAGPYAFVKFGMIVQVAAIDHTTRWYLTWYTSTSKRFFTTTSHRFTAIAAVQQKDATWNNCIDSPWK